MGVSELREELHERKVDHSDCLDVEAMRNRLLTTLLVQADSEAKSHLRAKIPRAAIAIAPAWTGYKREVLCLIPAWDFEQARRSDTTFVSLHSVRTSVSEYFARERREILLSEQEVANVCFDALIALCLGADGVRMVLPAEHPAALRLAKMDVGVVASELGQSEMAAQGTPQMHILHGGKFITGSKGVPDDEQLEEFLQMAADLDDRV